MEFEHHSMETLLGKAAGEFLDELQRGSTPDVDDYARRYPEIAEVLREMLDVLDAMHLPGAAGNSARCEGRPRTRAGLGRLGDFHIVREIGRGGMGIVYEAQQISLGRRVALKVLPAATAMDSKRLQRFRNEAHAAAHLHHQNIVPVHAVGQVGGMHYYAMQYIEGQTLAALIQELRRLNSDEPRTEAPETTRPLARVPDSLLAAAPPSEAQPAGDEVEFPLAGEPTLPCSGISAPRASTDCPHSNASSVLQSDSSTHSRSFFANVARLGVQAADALEHAHSMGIVHRDIKPGNILLDLRGNLWITDFGLAHIHGDTQLTTTGDILGTLRYMSPEQALGRRGLLDQRTDIYSLGITLYELATLEHPFEGDNRQDLLRQIAFEEPRAPRKINRSIPRDLETILLKAIAKDPSGRYTTAGEMADDLRRFQADEPIHARRPTVLQKAAKWCRRHRSVVSTAAVVAALGMVVTLFVAIRGQRLAEEQRDVAWSATFDMNVRAQKLLQYEPRMKEVQRDLLDKALSFYQNFVLQPATSPAGRFRKAQAFRLIAEIRCLQGAHWIQDAALDDEKQSASARQAARKLLAASADAAEQARTELEDLIADLPDDAAYENELAETEVTRARALSTHGDWDRDPIEPQRLDQAEKSYIQAAARFEKLANSFPDKRECLGRAAFCRSAVADLQEEHRPPRPDVQNRALVNACDILQRLVDMDPDNVEHRNALASVYRRQGELLLRTNRVRDAETALQAAARMLDKLAADFELLPESGYDMATTYWWLGVLRGNAQRYDGAERAYRKAVDACEKLVDYYPRVPRYQARLGTALDGLAHMRYFRHHSTEARDLETGALKHAKVARQASRDNLTYRYAIQTYSHFLGALLLELKEYRQACETAVAMADSIPTCPYGAKHAADLYAGCAEAALADPTLRWEEREALIGAYTKHLPGLLERIRTHGGGARDLQNDLACLLATFPDPRLRNPARAVDVAERVVRGDGKTECTNPDYWRTLGVARYRNGDWQRAVVALERSMRLTRGSDTTAALFLAMAHWQLGERSKARESYEAALTKMKKQPTATPAIRRLRQEAEGLLGSSNLQSRR
jgi:serine/threonine protein kinase/tetratricopeptide (TPR) repeat protein